MRNAWVTAIIIITWIASTITILAGNAPVFIVILLSFAATFYFIIFGLQKQKE